MDSFIITLVGVSVVAFLGLQILVFRVTHPDRALLWLIKLYFIVEGASILAGYMIWDKPQFEMIAMMHGLLFGGLVVIYIISVFSYAEASITTNMFVDIARAGQVGLSYAQLKARFGIARVVDRRLARFIANGDVRKNGRYYEWQNKWSLFTLREHGLRIMHYVFPAHE